MSEDQLRLVEATTGVGAFQADLTTGQWAVTTPQTAALFGLDPRTARPSIAEWETAIFNDDRLKMRAALEAASESQAFNVEIRGRCDSDGVVHWLAGRGEIVRNGVVRGTWHDITERKALESRLLALTETLEARVAELREEARAHWRS